MQWQLPIVSCVEGAIPEILGGANCGVLIDKRRAHGLAAELERLIRDDVRRRRLGERARQRYLELYTSDRFQQRLARALETIVRQEQANDRLAV